MCGRYVRMADKQRIAEWFHVHGDLTDLHARDYDRWLDRDETERLPLDLLRPYEAEEMEMHEANPLVGNARNSGSEMLRRQPKGLPPTLRIE